LRLTLTPKRCETYLVYQNNNNCTPWRPDSSWPMCMHLVGRYQADLCVCTWWADLKTIYVYARGGLTSRRPMCMCVLG